MLTAYATVSVEDRKPYGVVTLLNPGDFQPRDNLNLQLATRDVPDSFRKLRDFIEKAKGQIIKGTVNEQNKLNVTAELEFAIAAVLVP